LARSGQESGVREIRSRRLRWRGLETGSRQPYTGTKLETADTAKGSLRGTAPVLDPTILFGHFGAGGSLGFADPDAHVAFAYAMNQGRGGWQHKHVRHLIDLVYEAL
jgi:CubicO group peptidase (beta-lactamase class C family)